MRVADDRELRRRVIILVHENTLAKSQRTAPVGSIVCEEYIPRTLADASEAAIVVIRWITDLLSGVAQCQL